MKTLFTLLLLCAGLASHSQTNLDSLNAKVTRMGSFLKILSDFRLVVYTQTQWQLADTAGAKTFAGGDFPATTNNRFSVRRGRVKLGFDHDGAKGFRVFQAVFQMDMSERGFQARDFYGRIIDPWIGWFGLQAGLMDRPFGYEVRTSDDLRESPERARMSQVIFPLEKDVGAEIVIKSPKTFKPVYLRLDAGLFNGTGVLAGAFSSRKDFIGSVKAAKTFGYGTLFTLSGGASMYYGNTLQQHTTYDIEPRATGNLAYVEISDSLNANKRYYGRRYGGVDVQASVDYKIGTTAIRGEFIAGQQPGTSSANVVPTTLAPGTDLYVRKFNGAYFYFIQTFKQPVKDQTLYHELVVKFDWYTPNGQVAQKDLSSINDPKVSAADVTYYTLGFGYRFRPADYFLFMLFYDYVINANTNINGYGRDLKDNVLTIRAQFKFDTDWFNKKVKAATL